MAVDIKQKIVEVLDDIFSTDLPTPTEMIADYILEEIDVEEVVHGRWTRRGSIYKCSLCACCVGAHWNYCPNCGAKMDGKEEAQ